MEFNLNIQSELEDFERLEKSKAWRDICALMHMRAQVAFGEFVNVDPNDVGAVAALQARAKSCMELVEAPSYLMGELKVDQEKEN